MLLFSTILPIEETLTKDKFIELVIKWNQESPHKENIISGIEWNGERNIRYGTDELWLDIQEYRNKNIIAVRYEKIEEDGTVWDTDYVMNFNEKKMSIRLDRSYKEEALIIGEKFSTPHFITMLIENGYLKKDGALPILRDPIFITEDNVDIIADIVKGNTKYSMPIVYVSKTTGNNDPVHIGWLSSRLKGIAHVLVQENKTSNEVFRKSCEDKNEYSGAIGIYYPNVSVGHKRFLYHRDSDQDMLLLNKIVRHVIQYSIEQNVDKLYTWQGVSNDLLTDRLAKQREERLAAELAKQETKDETDKLLAEFDEDMESLQKKVEELTKSNEALRNEAEWLRAKLNARGHEPVLYLGEEDEFYPGEIKDLLLSVLEDSLKNRIAKSRRADILRDIIRNNDYQHISEQREKEIKTTLKGYTHVSATIKQTVMDLGFEITEEGKHYKLTYYGDGRYWTTIAKTPSDSRVGDNVATRISREMF